MAFESFGRLPFGSVFRFRGKNWVKIAEVQVKSEWVNAFEPTETGIPGEPDEHLSTCRVDEATLVSLESDISEERQKQFRQLFVSYDPGNKT